MTIRMYARFRVLITLLCTSIICASITSYAQEHRIHDITIQDNQRIEASTIESYLDITRDAPYQEEQINTSLKNLYSSGLFSDVSIRQEGDTLIVKVEENPIINKVVFEGNKHLKEDTLSTELSLKPRSVYTRSRLQDDVDRIQGLYQKNGRFSVRVEPKIIKLDQNRVDLVFEIDEGKKTTIGVIRFIGNDFFDTKELKSVIHSRENHWYTFFTSNDTYDTDRIAFDKELLRKHYLSQGFADFKVVSSIAEITPDKHHFILTFTLEEGSRYTFGKIDVQSKLPNLQTDTLKTSIQTKSGKVFNADLINGTVEGMTDYLNNNGYAFVEIKPDYDRHTDTHILDITYTVEEGPKVYVDRINVTGNVRTLDKVIRREFRIAEGDPFNASKIKRSRERVQNLGFFDKVDITNQPGSAPDKTDIDVKVSEHSTGELNFGAGFSTTDGALGNVNIRERNLLGKGQDLRLGYQQSTVGSQVNLGFTEPYFMDKDFSAGFDLYNTTRDLADESSYSSSSHGGTLRGSYSLSEYLRHTLYYSLEETEVSDVQADASAFVRDQVGRNLVSLVGHSLLYDKRDSSIDPKEGYFIQGSQEFAGVGGDSKYVKHEVKSGYFYPVYKREAILSIKAKGGTISGYGGRDVRINERFFIGGTVIRGFDNAGIGPRDRRTLDALGGNNYYAGTTELMFPLGLPEELDFKGAIFMDAGSLFGTDKSDPSIADINSIRSSAGVGLAWSSPLGPIRLDYAYPLSKEPFDKQRNFQFNFGTKF